MSSAQEYQRNTQGSCQNHDCDRIVKYTAWHVWHQVTLSFDQSWGPMLGIWKWACWLQEARVLLTCFDGCRRKSCVPTTQEYESGTTWNIRECQSAKTRKSQNKIVSKELEAFCSDNSHEACIAHCEMEYCVCDYVGLVFAEYWILSIAHILISNIG